MANEAVLRTKLDEAIDFTCADGTGIEKGTLLKLTDPRTAIIVSADDDPIAGICAREKIASDGRTRVAVFRRGIFDMVSSGTVAINDSVVAHASPGVVEAAGVNAENIIGTALEAGSGGETIQIELNPRSINVA